MLDIPSLKAVAAKRLEAALKSEWDPTGFAEVVAEVYATSNTRDSDIRGTLIESAKSHLKELLLLDTFKEVLFSNGEFSGGLVMAGRAVVGRAFATCRGCGGYGNQGGPWNCYECGIHYNS